VNNVILLNNSVKLQLLQAFNFIPIKLTRMKGNKELIAVLYSLMADELTAINQYRIHSEMCEYWCYGKLYKTL